MIFFSLLHNVRAQLNQNLNTGGGGLWPTQDPSQSASHFAENNNENNNIIMTKNSINLALSPIENDLLTMNIKEGGEANYNIHELPNNDGKSFNILFYSAIYLGLVQSLSPTTLDWSQGLGNTNSTLMDFRGKKKKINSLTI